MDKQKPQYSGYGYHGGGRPRKSDTEKKKFKTVSISGTVEEIENLKGKATKEGKSLSQYVLEKVEIRKWKKNVNFF